MNKDSSEKQIPFSNNIEKVLQYISSHLSQPLPSYYKCSLSDGELRIQNDVNGILIRTKPNLDGIWKIRCWLTGYDQSGWGDKRDLANFILLVAESTEPLKVVEACGDYLEESELAYHEVAQTLRDVMRNMVQHRDHQVLYRRIPGLTLTDEEHGSHPFQANGTWGKWSFYFRYKNNNASLAVGRNSIKKGEENSFELIRNPYWYSEAEYDSEVLTIGEFSDIFCDLWTALKPESFEYEFKPINGSEAHPLSARVRAVDARQAWLATLEYPFKGSQYEMTPVKEDYRIYPWPAEKFVVLDYKP